MNNNHHFAISLNPDIQVISAEDKYTLQSAESDPTALLTLATTPGISVALDYLKAGNTTTESLIQALAKLDGGAAGEQFSLILQQLDERGWLSYAVLPLAVAVPMVDSAELNLTQPHWTQTNITLSRFAYQHPYEGTMVLESPLSKFRVKLLDWRASAILAQLAQPKTLGTITPPPYLGPETAYQFLNLLWATGFLTTDPEIPSLQLWDFHNLLFHSRSRSGRHDYPLIDVNTEQWFDFPVVKPPMSDKIVPLPRPNLGALMCNDATLTEVIEARQSVRQNDDNHPIGLMAEIQLAETGEVSENTGQQVGETLSSAEESVGLSGLTGSTSEITASEVLASESGIVEDETASATVLASEVESSATKLAVALHPHDLDARIPGLADLRNQTLGDPQITIVVLEGNPDHSLSCFQSDKISKVFPYWLETPEPFSPEEYATFREIEDSDRTKQEKQEALKATFTESQCLRLKIDDHTSHVTSIIVGQENTPSPGIAPNCRVINLPLNSVENKIEFVSALSMARAFEQALNLGANIIHCGMCRPAQTGEDKGEELFAQAVKKCLDNNILIVAPAGNGLGEYWCLPAVLPGTLPVGAMDLGSPPAHYNNWGGNYTEEGIMAPGDDIWGAQLATETPRLRTGTSGAAPIVTGIAALLMSLQLQQGKPVDAEAVRTALLNTAIPCDPKVVEEPERGLRGFVNIPGAMGVLFGQPSVTISFAGDQVTRTERVGYAMPTVTAASQTVQPATPATPTEASVTAAADAATVEASTAFSGHVYALGTLGYDFGDEARRDTFKQLMAPAEIDGFMVPANPYDARQMVQYLDRNPDEARSLIWTLNLDQNTIYALEPKGPFAQDVYETLLLMLAAQLEPETHDEFVERISVAATRTNRTVELFSGEVVPVVTLHNVRGMYGWTVNALLNSAIASIRNMEPEQEPIMREAISAFLNRVYYDLHNLGQTSRDRALNFAATNIFQATSVFADAIASGRQLDTISVEKSPYCRIRSDCWDVLLTFFDPDSSRRSRQVFRFTLDVAANLPVTIGSIKRWSIPGKVS